ncbi:MAG: hypothetical protein P1P90_01880 [Patescibacteria group bacterium]|nr:hypothetical protein [Patescibacteria group bacterium]
MPNAEAERYKIEWFYGIDLFLKSKEGESYLNDLLGAEADRDEVEYKVFLMLLETEIRFESGLIWETEKSLTRWCSIHRESARNNFLAGKFARNDLWDQRKWDARFEELRLSAKNAAFVINQIIEDAKAELEDDIKYERQTPIVPVAEMDRLRCAKPSDMVTLQCEKDPEAMARVQRYLEEVGSNPTFLATKQDAFYPESTPKKTQTIFPPPSVPPGSPDAELVLPQNNAPSIIPSEKNKPEDPEISISYENSDED